MANPFRAAQEFLLPPGYSWQERRAGHRMESVVQAINAAYLHDYISRSERNTSVAAVQRALGQWHSERGFVKFNVLGGWEPAPDDLQAYRLRWLQHLAQQWDENIS